MRRRKILEATVLFALASFVCIYFVGEYVRYVAFGGGYSWLGLFVAMLSGLAIAAYQIELSMRFLRAGFKGAPWMPGLRGQPVWRGCIWYLPPALFLIDVSLRAYQWSAGVELVRMPENFVVLFGTLSAMWAMKSLYYRRWLLSLP